ncbi:MAG: type II toxin-antitoxin system HicB family antitoxin [Anaerolineae bacterium]
MRTFTAFVEYDPETQLYIGMIPNVPGVHTQGATLDELRFNLQEVLELCWEEGLLQVERQFDLPE